MNENNRHIQALRRVGFIGDYITLRRLEGYANKLALDMCNVPMTEDEEERRKAHIEKRIAAMFGGTQPDGFFVDYDPRGHALKIEDEKTPDGMHKDFGGYGILAPENK